LWTYPGERQEEMRGNYKDLSEQLDCTSRIEATERVMFMAHTKVIIKLCQTLFIILGIFKSHDILEAVSASIIMFKREKYPTHLGMLDRAHLYHWASFLIVFLVSNDKVLCV
jgi:hypothetical protein